MIPLEAREGEAVIERHAGILAIAVGVAFAAYVAWLVFVEGIQIR